MLSLLYLAKPISPLDPLSKILDSCRHSLLDISTCLSNKHLQLNRNKSQFLIFFSKPVLPEHFSFWFLAILSFQISYLFYPRAGILGVILAFSLSLTFSVYSELILNLTSSCYCHCHRLGQSHIIYLPTCFRGFRSWLSTSAFASHFQSIFRKVAVSFKLSQIVSSYQNHPVASHVIQRETRILQGPV